MADLHDLLEMHARLADGRAPSIFETRHPSTSGQEYVRDFGVAPVKVERSDHSHTILIELHGRERFSPNGPVEEEHESFIDVALQLARQEDDRAFARTEGERRGFEIARFRSEIDGIDVIGPGGGVTVSQFGDRLRGDAPIRSRSSPLDSRWRDPQELAAELEDRIRGPYDRLEFEHGYFEASQYVHQWWIRPVWLIHVDRNSSEHLPGRRYSVVVASTNSRDLPDSAGIEGTGVGGCNEP